MAVINVVQLYLCSWMGKGELLHDTVVLLNVPGPLLVEVQLTAINLVAYHGTQMLQFIHPRQRIPTKVHVWEVSRFVEECQALGFAQFRVWIS